MAGYFFKNSSALASDSSGFPCSSKANAVIDRLVFATGSAGYFSRIEAYAAVAAARCSGISQRASARSSSSLGSSARAPGESSFLLPSVSIAFAATSAARAGCRVSISNRARRWAASVACGPAAAIDFSSHGLASSSFLASTNAMPAESKARPACGEVGNCLASCSNAAADPAQFFWFQRAVPSRSSASAARGLLPAARVASAFSASAGDPNAIATSARQSATSSASLCVGKESAKRLSVAAASCRLPFSACATPSAYSTSGMRGELACSRTNFCHTSMARSRVPDCHSDSPKKKIASAACGCPGLFST